MPDEQKTISLSSDLLYYWASAELEAILIVWTFMALCAEKLHQHEKNQL